MSKNCCTAFTELDTGQDTNLFRVGWVGGDTIAGDNMAKIPYFRLAFGGFEVQPEPRRRCI
jgi:hypothetical protein